MPRRCYHIRMDAKRSRPYEGREFKHDNLAEWVEANRAPLLRALLIIARGWYQRKVKSTVKNPLGSFESWHRTIGGILHSAGVDGFLSNFHTFLDEADNMALQWENFLSELRGEYIDEWFTVSKVIAEVRSSSALNPSHFTIPDSLADVDRRREEGTRARPG